MEIVIAGLLGVIAGLLGWIVRELRHGHRLAKAVCQKQLVSLDGILNATCKVRDTAAEFRALLTRDKTNA